jgi:putative hydrolase of the HAD superfamily
VLICVTYLVDLASIKYTCFTFLLLVRFMIKNLIFDFGGVIINLDPKRMVMAFAELGVKDIEKVNKSIADAGLYLDLEMGLITPAGFREGMRKCTGLKLTDSQVDNAWNAMILDIPPSRLALLEELKENYNIFLLSNTNEIHYMYFNKYLSETYGIQKLDQIFTKCYYSHQLKLRKPEPEIFLKVLSLAGLKADECLFIDDSKENVKTARDLGIHGITHHPGEEINQYFVEGRIRD